MKKRLKMSYYKLKFKKCFKRLKKKGKKFCKFWKKLLFYKALEIGNWKYLVLK